AILEHVSVALIVGKRADRIEEVRRQRVARNPRGRHRDDRGVERRHLAHPQAVIDLRLRLHEDGRGIRLGIVCPVLDRARRRLRRDKSVEVQGRSPRHFSREDTWSISTICSSRARKSTASLIVAQSRLYLLRIAVRTTSNRYFFSPLSQP